MIDWKFELIEAALVAVTSVLSIIFLTAYAAMRFFVALIRCGEAREILHEAENLRAEFQEKLLRKKNEPPNDDPPN